MLLGFGLTSHVKRSFCCCSKISYISKLYFGTPEAFLDASNGVPFTADAVNHIAFRRIDFSPSAVDGALLCSTHVKAKHSLMLILIFVS